MRSGKDILTVGGWAVHADRNEIERGGQRVRIEPMSMRLLTLLIASHGKTTTRDEIVDCLWQGRVVSEDAITKQISKLRAALGDDPRAPEMIQTVPKVGVRLIPAPATGSAVQPQVTRSVRSTVWAAGLALFVAAGTALLLVVPTGDDRPPRVVQSPLTATPALESEPALSPDGNWLAYVSRVSGSASSAIMVRTLADESARAVSPQGMDARSPAWSAGGQLAFVATRPGGCTIMVGSPLGPFRPVAACVDTLGLAWAGENQIIVAAHPRVGASFRLWRIDLSSGRITPITAPPPGALGDRFPVSSAEGGKIYFARTQTVGVEDLLELDLSSRELRTLVADGAHIVGLASGGEGQLLVSSSRGGTMALWRLNLARNSWRQLLPEVSAAPTASADGRRIVVARSEARTALWARSLQGGRAVAVTDTTQSDWSPVAAPDGSLAFLSRRSGTRELWLIGRDGEPRRLTRFNGAEIQDPAWSPASDRVALALPAEGNFDIVFVDVASGAVRRITEGPPDDRHPTFSPDGRTLYFARRSGERFALMRRDLASGREDVVSADGLRAVATPDGRRLYFGRLFTSGLFELELATGVVRSLTSWPVWDDMRNWSYGDGSLWGIDRTPTGGRRLMRFDPVSGEQRQEGELESVASASGLAISRNQIFYSRLLETRSDLILLRLEDD